ncbi:hypothetical protein LXA43DRAFT_1028571 [Ganoderma leucocontextum]|nr:hypothetical protein LXA43DRAFT_1028571 [Ganoderma leucocontextum]
MPHSFVHLKFDPKLTAYWLPPSGQLAAAKIPVEPFWALRTNWDGDESDLAPGFIFVVSSDPSPFPLQNASFTLGPKFATDTGAHWNEAATLRMTKPIHTIEEDLSCPLYLHTVPTLPINPYARPPIKAVNYQLDKPSLNKFLRVAHELLPVAWDFRTWHKRRHGRTGGSECIQEDWSTFGEWWEVCFGGTKRSEDLCVQVLGGALPVFRGVCKDYKWTGAERTIDWVRDARKNTFSSSQPDFEACVASPSATTSTVLSDPLWRADALLLCEMQYPPLDPEPVDCDSDTESEFLETTFPRFPYRFPSVSMPARVCTVAFDLFGTILDRDGAIKDALTAWSLVRGCRKTATQLTKLYLESEALINFHSSSTPISLARIVHSALTALSERLDLRISPYSTLFIDAMTRILSPTLFADVEPAIAALVDRGIRLVCFPPHSVTTMDHYKRGLPQGFLDRVSFSPTAAPVHTEASREIFRSMCGQPTFGASLAAHSDREILVVSTGVGRILAPAIKGEYATALLKRPESVEANVDFCFDLRPGDNPVPSLVVHGLMELCAALKLL